MRFGICTALNNINILEKIGCDYIEPALNSIALLDEQQFSKCMELIQTSNVKCEATNCFFPWDMKIVGRDIDKNKISEYIKNALHRASLLEVKVFVIGSGSNRKCPEDWHKKDGVEQFSQLLFEIAEEAKKYDMIAALEPLNKIETNIVNSVAEGLEIVKNINHSNLKLLADFYHMRMEQENPIILMNAAEYLHHVHIANSNGRTYPEHINEDDYQTFFDILKQTGYDKRVSIEASTGDMEKEGYAALNLLRLLCE